MPAHWLPDTEPEYPDDYVNALVGSPFGALFTRTLVRGSSSPRAALTANTEIALRAIAAEHVGPSTDAQYHADAIESIFCCLYRPVGHRRRTDRPQGGNVALWTALLLSVILPMVVMAAHGLTAVSAALGGK